MQATTRHVTGEARLSQRNRKAIQGQQVEDLNQEQSKTIAMRRAGVAGNVAAPLRSTILCPNGEAGATSAQILAAELAEELYGTSTTFVQADPSNFRELVQKLTGSTPTLKAAETPPLTLTLGREGSTNRVDAPKATVGGAKSGPGPHRIAAFKLHERRQNAKKVELKHLTRGGVRSSYSTPSPALSPVSPLNAFDIFESYGSDSYSAQYSPQSQFSPQAFSCTQNTSQDCVDDAEVRSPLQSNTVAGQIRLLNLFPLNPLDQ